MTRKMYKNGAVLRGKLGKNRTKKMKSGWERRRGRRHCGKRQKTKERKK